MKSMNHLNKVLLVSLIALPFTSSDFLAGDEPTVVGSDIIQVSKPSLMSRAYSNMSRACGSAYGTVSRQVRQHPVVARCIGGLAGTAVVGAVGKKLYNKRAAISSKAKKACDACVSRTKTGYSWIKNHKLVSGLVAGAGALALDLWKKPIKGKAISATMAKGLYSWLNNRKKAAHFCGFATIPALFYYLRYRRSIGKQQRGEVLFEPNSAIPDYPQTAVHQAETKIGGQGRPAKPAAH
jgi:hypothetical protein